MSSRRRLHVVTIHRLPEVASAEPDVLTLRAQLRSLGSILDKPQPLAELNTLHGPVGACTFWCERGGVVAELTASTRWPGLDILLTETIEYQGSLLPVRGLEVTGR